MSYIRTKVNLTEGEKDWADGSLRGYYTHHIQFPGGKGFRSVMGFYSADTRELIGWVMYHVSLVQSRGRQHWELVLELTVIDPAMRGRGLFKKMIEGMIDFGIELGVKEVKMEIVNPIIKSTARSLGFHADVADLWFTKDISRLTKPALSKPSKAAANKKKLEKLKQKAEEDLTEEQFNQLYIGRRSR